MLDPEPKPEPESCMICIEPYKGKKVVKVTCQYCPYSACRGCQQRYILQSYEDPHCMDCKRGWSPEFMAANFPLVFRNDTLRKHRRKVLLEREKATLPAMQIFVEYRREIRRLDELARAQEALIGRPVHRPIRRDGGPQEETTIDPEMPYGKWRAAQDAYNAARTKLVVTRDEIAKHKRILLEPTGTPAPLVIASRAKLTKLRQERAAQKEDLLAKETAYNTASTVYNDLNRTLQTLYTERWRTQRRYDGLEVGGAAGPAQERREFIMKCPDDGCRGFLSQAYKCGTCAKFTCTKCLYVLGLEKECGHECKPEEVESAKAIRAETRPCPKCGTRIFKVDGCDQMWCTMDGCHTAFSWNTGHVVTGVVHNPHYYEWLRRTGGGHAPREHGDIPCGGLPAAWTFQRILMRSFLPREALNNLYEMHRNLREITDWRIRDFPARPPAMVNKEIDVQYLMQEIDEKEWQRQLEFTEAKFRRKKEIGQILQMAATAGADMLNRVQVRGEEYGIDHVDQYTDWLQSTAIPELETLRVFVNDSLKALAKREHMAVPQLGAQWVWQPLRALYRPPPKKKGAAAAGVGLVGLADPAENEIVELPDEPEVVEILD